MRRVGRTRGRRHERAGRRVSPAVRVEFRRGFRLDGPGRRVRATSEGGWIDTEIRFEISPREGGSEPRFTHVGLHPDSECCDVCSGAWNFFVGDSLRALLSEGAGAPITPADEERHRKELGVA